MLKVKSGKTALIAVLFDKYADYLYNYFFKLCNNQHVSEDLTQNVFLRIIKYSSSFNTKMSFKSWIFQIARNQFYDHSYKLNREKNMHSDILSENLLDDNTDEKQERYKLLELAISSLPVETREILILAKYQNYKYKELADTYNTSEGAIKVKVHRSINELRKKYFELLNM